MYYSVRVLAVLTAAWVVATVACVFERHVGFNI